MKHGARQKNEIAFVDNFEGKKYNESTLTGI
jgi:hypothetical protein